MMERMVRWTCLGVLLGVLGCAPTGPAAAPSTRDGAQTDRPAAPKTITLAQLNSIRTYGPWDFSNTSGGGASLVEIHTAGLISEDLGGNPEPRLAARIPSLDDGSVVLFPDGHMETTWKLRPGVRWHDGAPFTAADVVFSWQVMTNPDMLSSIEGVIRRAERVEALDPLTVRITWRTPFYRAVDIGHRDLWLFPKHLLGEPFEGDKQAFLALPYFTTDYVNLGPFRLVEFGLGEEQVFERFDGYFLGRPKVDKIVIRSIADPNTLLANLKAGNIDISNERTLPLDVFVQLRDEWRQTGTGTILQRQDNWWYLWFQFDPQWARPIELSQDVRLRRGLHFAFDRDAIRDLSLPGVADTSADTFMLKNDPRGPTVGQPYARYRFDQARALQDFGDGGWRRGADGRMRNQAGEQVQIELRGGVDNAKEVSAIADFWRQLGIDVSELIPPPALARDNEYKSKFPGLENRARGTGDQIFVSFDGRLGSNPQNRWQGANTAHYANPALDRLIDRVYGSIDQREQAQALRELGELMATDLPALALYFRAAFVAMNKGIRALEDDYAGTRGPASGPGLLSRNAHLWDRT